MKKEIMRKGVKVSEIRHLPLVAALGALTIPGMAVAQSETESAEQSSQEASAAAAVPAFTMKRCVNMGNALETPVHQDWGGRFYQKEDYQRIAAAGFDTVRIPIRWSAYLGPRPNYRIHPDVFEKVDQQLEWAHDAGLNIIINIHHFDELMEEPNARLEQFRYIWAQLAERYHQLPDSVWFEILNEPHKELKGALMRQMQAQALKIIRHYDEDRVVILGGEEWSGITSLGSNLSTDDPNVVYTFHYYDPFSFTHQQASWLGDEMPEGKRSWGSENDRKELANAIDIATGFRDAVKRPVFVGEFGANDPINKADRVKWAGAVRNAMEEADIPWCLWAYANTFALYDDESGWDEPMLKALVGDQ